MPPKKKTAKDLKLECQALGIRGFSNMKRSDMEAALASYQSIKMSEPAIAAACPNDCSRKDCNVKGESELSPVKIDVLTEQVIDEKFPIEAISPPSAILSQSPESPPSSPPFPVVQLGLSPSSVSAGLAAEATSTTPPPIASVAAPAVSQHLQGTDVLEQLRAVLTAACSMGRLPAQTQVDLAMSQIKAEKKTRAPAKRRPTKAEKSAGDQLKEQLALPLTASQMLPDLTNSIPVKGGSSISLLPKT